MTTTTITSELNSQLNQVIIALHKMLVPGIRIRGEFVANTNECKDYLAFVNLYGVRGLESQMVTHRRGVKLEDLSDTNKCIEQIIADIKSQGLINSYIFQ